MKLCVFCSNNVNGGTARIFYEFVNGGNHYWKDKNVEIVPCVNKNNTVEIYKKIEDLNFVNLESYNIKSKFKKGSPIYYINKIFRKLKYLKVYNNNILNARKFLRENNINAVICHNGGYVGDDLCNQMITAAFKEKLNIRVMVFHNDIKKNFIQKFRYYYYDKKITREATKLITVSKFTRDRILGSSYINKNIEVVYNGISSNYENINFENLNLNSKNSNILMIGNFEENKGQLNFIKAAKTIIGEIKNVHFVIIGNAYNETYFNECMNYITDYNLEKYIKVYQGIHNAQNYIGFFKLLVVPSLYDESFGLTSVEAMSKNVPIVAFSCGGIPEVVDHKRNGLLVPVGDNEKLCFAIKSIILDEQKLEILKKNCKNDFEERFSVKIMMQNYGDSIFR